MAEPVRVIFLGGLGEIGRNCMVIEQGAGDRRAILLIDCGLMFPDPAMHGIDLVLPDFTYLRDNVKARRLLSDGRYERIPVQPSEEKVNSQEYFIGF